METGAKIFVFVHVIWTTGMQAPFLKKPFRKIMYAHLQQLASAKLANIIAINGTDDHVHVLMQVHPTHSISQLVKSLMESSSAWLNENKLMSDAFSWDDEYSGYSVSPSNVRQVADYISKQEEHHKTKTLKQELEAFEKMAI